MKKRKTHLLKKLRQLYINSVFVSSPLIQKKKKEDVTAILTTVLAIIRDFFMGKLYQMLFSNKDMIRITATEATVL